MNPNQPHHQSGSFQQPVPQQPNGGWNQPPQPATSTNSANKAPIVGAYVLATVLGVTAILIAVLNGGGSSTENQAGNGLDQASKDKRACAVIGGAVASLNGWSSDGKNWRTSADNPMLAGMLNATRSLEAEIPEVSPGIAKPLNDYVREAGIFIQGVSKTGGNAAPLKAAQERLFAACEIS